MILIKKNTLSAHQQISTSAHYPSAHQQINTLAHQFLFITGGFPW
jgi:hypothetical protein